MVIHSEHRTLAATGARYLGIAVAAITALMWVYAMWMPGTEAVFSGWSFAVAFLMLVFSIIAVIAAFRGHANVLLGMFLAAFLPIGAYLIRVDHWLRWVGVLNLCLLVAAILMKWAMSKRAELDG